MNTLTQILDTTFPHVKTLVWDLDGTLGHTPGWGVYERIEDYVINYDNFVQLLNHLSDTRGLLHIMASRNLQFCGQFYELNRARFRNMGFDYIMPCQRNSKYSKLRWLPNAKTCLLIDNDMNECTSATMDGGQALHVRMPLWDALHYNELSIVM